MTRIIANATLLTVVCLLFTAAGYSQQTILKADVPFEFSVGQKTFPAGEYRVVQIAPHTLTLRDNNNHGFLFPVITGQLWSIEGRPTPQLKFEYAEGQYALSAIWLEGTTEGHELLVHKRLRGTAQKQGAGVEVSALAAVADEK